MTDASLPLLTSVTPTPDGALLHVLTESGHFDVLPVPYGAVLNAYQRLNFDTHQPPSLHLTVFMGDVLWSEAGDTCTAFAHVLVPDSDDGIELLRTLKHATSAPKP